MAVSFSSRVLILLSKIPRGKITTYKEIALAFGNPSSARAVGNACNANPFAPEVPCHRVVKSTGEIGNYSGGVKKKTALLEAEGVVIKNNRIKNFDRLLFKF